MKTAKLLLHCPDKPGILAEVTDFITVNKGNIIYLDQYVDHVEYLFYAYWMGIERFSGASGKDWGLFCHFVCTEIWDEFPSLFLRYKTAYGYLCFKDVPLLVRLVGALHRWWVECGDTSYHKQSSRFAACGRAFRYSFPSFPHYQRDKGGTREEGNGVTGKA